MPTTNFAWNDAAIVPGGLFSLGSFDGGVHNYSCYQGRDSELAFVAHGTDLSLSYMAGSPLVVLIVDGVTTTPTLVANFTWNTLAVFSGLSDGPHTVVVRGVTASNLFVESGTHNLAFQLTGSAPSLSTYPGYSNAARVVLATDQASGTPKCVLEGMLEPVSQGYSAYGASYGGQAFGGGSVRFRGNPASVNLWAFHGAGLAFGGIYRLLIDGQGQTPVAAARTDVTFGWLALATGLDTTAEHEYEAVFDSPTGGNQIYEIMLVGGTGFDPTFNPAARPTMGVMTDSIGAGYYVGSSQSYPARLARVRGMAVANAGILGSTVAGGSGMVLRTASLTRLGSAMTRCIVAGGVNDAVGGTAVGTFQTAYQTLLQNLYSACPACDYWCVGILPEGAATATAYNAAIVAAVAAFKAANPSATVRYFDPSAWASSLVPGGDYRRNYVASATDGYGDLHPNGLGHGLAAALVEGDASGAGAVFPAPSDVRLAVAYGASGADETGTLHVPTAAQVLAGVAVDATTGTVVLPAAGQVEVGVNFGAGSATAGTVVIPPADQVEGGVAFGPGGATVGTAPDPATVAAAVWAYAGRSLTA